MAAAGIRDILIANQIVGPIKIDRLVRLADRAEPIVCVDSIDNLAELDAAFTRAPKRLRVAIEVNIGMNRAGVEPACRSSHWRARSPAVRVFASSAWRAGRARPRPLPTRPRRSALSATPSRARPQAPACTAAGHNVAVVSCGGTGTFPYCAQQPGVTEVQVGGAIFSDMHYLTHYHVDFAPALTVLDDGNEPTDADANRRRRRQEGDERRCGDAGATRVAAHQRNETVGRAHTIDLEQPSTAPGIGDKIELIVGYSDTTVHLHEEIVCVRGGRIESIWRIAGRGKLK